MNMSFLKLLLLVKDGDIESNPGPLTYSITKSVTGSNNQGDLKYGETAGKQCMCNALYAIGWALIRRIGNWKKDDLDHILDSGDAVYKSLGTQNFLSFEEIPNSLELEGVSYRIDKLGFSSDYMFKSSSDSLKKNHDFQENEGNGYLLLFKGYTISITWSKAFFFLFDSHSRDSEGRIVANGTSVLLRFRSLTAIEKYITYNYMTSEHSLPYEMQYIAFTLLSSRPISIEPKNVSNKIKRKRSYDAMKASGKYDSFKQSQKYQKTLETNRVYKQSPQYKEAVKRKKICHKDKTKNLNPDDRILRFKRGIRDGFCYICVMCNRSFHRKTVILFHIDKYELPQEPFFFIAHVKSFDGKEYICATCNKSLIKSEIPCQAVCNKLEIFEFPPFIPKLRRLEKIIIAKRLLFKKIAIMPKGQSPKLKGAICNVPIETDAVCNVLPRGADSNGIVMVKLKRKLAFRGHVNFEAVRPDVIFNVLEYLKISNHLYTDVIINEAQIANELLCLNENEEHPVVLESENLEDTENPHDRDRIGASETVLISSIPTDFDNETLNIAPGEGKKPLSLLTDKFCEELAHPHLFPTGKFGFNVNRMIPLSPSRYFNQRLLNYRQRFASESDYIFFAHSVYQQLCMNSRINIAMRKVCSNRLTAGMLSQNFKERVKDFVANDEAYSFMKTIKGTPAYWKKFLLEVLAMVKQLGLPTFFMTLSCADLRWLDLPILISKLNGKEMTEQEVNDLTYDELCALLNSNPVVIARHFQYRVELFFKEIVVNGPLGKVTYYAIRVEFQVRGSPHIHSFLWVTKAPKLSSETKNEYIAFIDQIVRANLPDVQQEFDLFKLVKTYQIHFHSKSCRKYKNVECRYHFGKFFTDRTIVSEPLPANMPESEKNKILQKRANILEKVKNYIDNYLDPRKRNIIDPNKDDFESPLSISEILSTLSITSEQYYDALSISPDQDFQLHLMRPPNSCFVNNYFVEGLQAWEANIDIQPVFNHYKAVSYMCAYFSKSEDESSQAMKQAALEAKDLKKTTLEQMKAIGKAYMTKRECSVVEAVYHVLSQLWLSKKYPTVSFINTNMPEKRFRVFRSEEELNELPEDSTDVFMRNTMDRYVDRPNATFQNGKYSVVDAMCLAEFASYYYLPSRKNIVEDDYQPEVFEDQYVEENHTAPSYPKKLPLMNDRKEVMQCRKVKLVMRYHAPNYHKKPEEYAHHMLLMYYPFRSETALHENESKTYTETLLDPAVAAIVNENKIKFEPYGELVDAALDNLRTNLMSCQDSYAQQENDEVDDMLQSANQLADEEPDEEPVLFDESDTNYSSASSSVLQLNDEKINRLVRLLNDEQRQGYDYVIRWARRHVKYLSCVKPKKVEPIHMFITGGAGVGKSHLATTIFQSLNKLMSYHAGDAEKVKVMMIALTGVAAVNVDGATIHSAMGIPVGNFRQSIPKLNDKNKSKLRNLLSSLKVILIDEVSMVDQFLIIHVHQRLTEVFGTSEELPFAGLPVISCGDFYQLPPINKRPIFAEYKDAMLNISPLWRLFRMIELTEVMRQKGDDVFIQLLNKVRIGKVDHQVETLLKDRFVKETDENYPKNAMHIWAENKPVNDHNERMLADITEPLYTINTIDILPKSVSSSLIDKALSRSQSSTGGLAAILHVKQGSRVMITSNIDVSDRLSNGQIGTVTQIHLNGNVVSCIYVKMDDEKAGLNLMRTDPVALHLQSVPIKKIEADIRIHQNRASSPVIKRMQFPLMLAWACTVHKVQGKQFKEAVISFELQNQRSFNYGQIYVALSRVTSLSGLYLIGEFNPRAIRADPKATTEYELLREEYHLQPVENLVPSESTLTISLLNTRSLKKHVNDIKQDRVLYDADILCLTETQLQEDSEFDDEEFNNDFEVLHNMNQDKFCSVAMCYKSNAVELHSVYQIPSASLACIEKNGTFFNIMLLYRKNGTKTQDLIYLIEHMVSQVSDKLHIILGDFNLDAFKSENDPVRELLSNYKLIVDEPTHLSGSLLDHVYVRNDVMENLSVECIIKSIFFSDHDVVKFQITFSNSCDHSKFNS